MKAPTKTIDPRTAAMALAVSEVRRAIDEFRGSSVQFVPAMRGYDSAEPGVGRPSMKGTSGAAYSQLSWHSHVAMRKACQHMVRSDLAARAVVKMWQALLVGDGAIVRCISKNAGWNKMVDARFDRWARGRLRGDHPDCTGRRTYWQLCRLVPKAWATDGDILTVRLGAAAGKAKGSIQMIESERIQNPGNVRWNTPGYINGVQVDKYLRPVAYHVAQWNTQGTATTLTTVPIEADAADLLINDQDDTAGMVRGEPALQAMRPRLERLNRYVENHGLAAYIQTLVALFIESNSPADLQAALEETVGQQPTTGPGEAKMEPGAIFTGRPGEKINSFNPTAPNINYRDYVWCELVMCAADLGVPASYAFFDVAGSSYITERAKGAVAARRHWCPQEALSSFVAKTHAWKVEQWVAEGHIPATPEDYDVEIKWPKPPIFDLLSEVSAHREAVDANFMTLEEAVQNFGGLSAESVIATRGREMEMQRKAGVVPADKPGAARPEADPKDPTTTTTDAADAPPADEQAKDTKPPAAPSAKKNPRTGSKG